MNSSAVAAGGQEIPVVFDCDGAQLLGVVHIPDSALEYGVLTLVAGGPQYRGGCGRQLVSMARKLSKSGISVMRFDHRGLGESAGDFLGFQHVEDDLTSAIQCFMTQSPAVKKIILWGGCDAASAILINAWKFPEVAGVVLGNPFVSSEATQEVVLRQHYKARLRQWSFWRKALTFQYDYLGYFKSGLARLKAPAPADPPASSADNIDFVEPEGGAFIDKMLLGMTRFELPILFLMSGQSLVSKEFDALVDRSPQWKTALARGLDTRVDIPDADQTFSSESSRKTVNESVFRWILALPRSE